MNDPHRIATYLRLIAGQVAEAKGAIYPAESEAHIVLNVVQAKLRDLADRLEIATISFMA